jgi:hypothetical protein
LSTISTVSLCVGVEAPIQNINYHPKQKQEVVSSFTNVKSEGKNISMVSGLTIVKLEGKKL